MPMEIKSEPHENEPQKIIQIEPSRKVNQETLKTDSITISKSDKVKSFKCNRCQNIFSEYSDLKEHVKSCVGKNRTNEYNFACQKCRKQFEELSDLNNHMKKNTCKKLQISDESMEVFQCLLCQKIFKNSKDLNLHKVIVHPECKKPQTFRNSQNSNFPLSCRFCKKLFDNVVNFNYHQCKNQNLKPKPKMLKCQFCDYRFKKAEYLKTHIENVHQTKAQKLENYNSLSSILSCRFCKKTFKYVPTFTYHLSTAHGGENQQNLQKKNKVHQEKNKVHEEKNKVHEEKKPDLLKLAVDMSGIEKQSKEPFINFAFEKSNFTHSLGRFRISFNIRKSVSRQYFCFEFN